MLVITIDYSFINYTYYSFINYTLSKALLVSNLFPINLLFFDYIGNKTNIGDAFIVIQLITIKKVTA